MKSRNVLASFVAAALILACAGSSPERKREAAARMQMGITYLDQRNLPSAMKELTVASRLDPENPEIDVALGLAYQARGDFGKAAEYFRSAVEKKPDYAEAHNNLGIVLSRLGRGDEAIREFTAAASNVLYSTPEVAYYNLGEEYRSRKDLRKAEEMYRRSISLNDRYGEAYLRLALLYRERGQRAEAARVLESCVTTNPAFAPAWLDLGQAYVSLGRTREATEAFRNVLANTADPVLRKQATDSLNLSGQGKR